WRTASLWQHDRPTRRAWMLLAASVLVYWFASTAWDLLFIRSHLLTNTVWAESLNLPSYPLALLAILTFPGVYRNESSRVRFLLDVALLFVGGAFAAWYFTGPRFGAAQAATGRQVSALIYPGVDLLLMVATGIAFLRVTNPTTQRALGFLFAGRAAKTVASVWYTWLDLGNAYFPGHPVDAAWFIAWILAWIAARVPQYRMASGATDREQEQRRNYRSGALPVLSSLFVQL